MPVRETVQSTEEKEAVRTELAEKESAISKRIIGQLDLPTSLADAVDDEASKQDEKTEEPKKAGTEDVETTETKDDGDLSQPSEDSTDATDQSDSTEYDENGEAVESDDGLGEEDLIPKSKVQKRIDELTREKRHLESELNKIRKAKEESSKTEEDPDLAKLRKMSTKELQDLRRKAMVAWKNEADPIKAEQYIELQDKIDETIHSAPNRFQERQIGNYYSAIEDTLVEMGEKLTPETAKQIKGIAESIYAKSNIYQLSEEGQAEAWRQAVERYKEVSKYSVGKSKVNDLERKVNTLKKKVSLDTSSQKGSTKQADDNKSYRKALQGNSRDKQEWFKRKLNTDSLIPAQFKQT